MKKIIIGLCLLLIGSFSFGQGLKNIIVEKYYVSNAADAVGSSGTLPAGSFTYRIYVEMQAGYKFKAAYGVPSPVHQLIFTTTTSFFNNTDYGSTVPTFSKANAAKNSTLIDSYLTVGAACAGNYGVLKTEDDGLNNIVNNTSPKILQNNDIRAGIALTTQDGLLAGTPEAVTIVGFADTDINMFNDGIVSGNSFISSNGAWSSLNGASGPTSNNRVLIAQITTDGVFHYELNIQLQTPSLGVERYVAYNPAAGEYSTETVANLVGTYGAPNVLPTVSITAPATGSSYISGDAVNIQATAADTDGSISSVEFFVDGTSAGVVNTVPFSGSWTSTSGTHTLTAKATDNDGGQTVSSSVFINVANHIAPTISISAPTAGTTKNIGDAVAITALPTVFDGATVASVQYFVNGVSIGTILSSPWTINWTAVEGTASISAKVTDSRGAFATSAPIAITVIDPAGPPYQVTTSVNLCRAADIFCVPVVRTRDALVNCIGFDVVMQYDASKVRPTGFITVSNDLINPVYTSYAMNIKESSSLIDISVFLNNSATAGTSFNGIGQVFCVEFSKTTNFKAIDTALFSVSSLTESYNSGTIVKPVKSGKYITYKESIFNGSLKFWADNSAIAYDNNNASQYLITNIYGNNVNCNSKTVSSVKPDLSGNFVYDINNGQNINIERDIADITDVQPVINGFDALLTAKVLVDDPSFTPNVFQMIAMDVNQDGVISAGDLSQISQRSLLIINEFKQKWNYDNAGVSNGQKSKDWLFVDSKTWLNNIAYRKSTTYPQNDGSGYSKYKVPVVSFCLSVPVSNVDECTQISTETYQGILLGDINGNYKNLSNDGLLKNAKALVITPEVDKVIFDISKAITKGNYVEIPVSIISDDAISTLDFSFQFNDASLVFDSYVDNTNYIVTKVNDVASTKTLKFFSYSLTQNYEMNKPLVTLRFSKVASKVNPTDITSVKTYLNGDPAGVEILTTTTGISKINNDNMVKVYPNPATEILNVTVSEKSNIHLFDLAGKQIYSKTDINSNQTLEINVQKFTSGIYTMKVYNDKFVTIKKVVVK